jgi:hypothetical protein
MAAEGTAAGRVLADRYRIEAELGRGAAGVVHKGWDQVLDRPVAVKLLACRTDSLDRDRLLHEARAAAALSHPHIVGIHDAGEDGDTPYLVMELVEGTNLRQLGPLDWDTIVRLADEVLQALEHAHGRGLVHRDIKPENILVDTDDGRPRARLADFSVARVGSRRTATLDGAIVGTPFYLAPEQALGEGIDGRADLYSLGAVLYEMVSGRPPFSGADALVVIAEHLHAPVVPPRTFRNDVPPGLEAIIVRLLAKRPDDRFADAAAARVALAAVRLDDAEAPAVAPAASGTQALLSQLARGRLVGRRAELDRLRGILTDTLGGRGQMVLLSGEPGVGKSRLAQEMLVQARLSGARVLRGGSYEFEAATPYLPFVEALRGWLNETGDEALREATVDIAPDLARLAPELAVRLGPFPERPPLTPAEERLRLYDAVARLFRRLAGRGLVVFLDDLHWADQGSLALVHSLLRNITADPILILGAYREVELDRSHPLAAALVEWNRERLVTRLPLGRLSAAETRSFLATLFGQETVGEAFAGAIHKETEGNPFFLEEVVKALIEQGQIYRDGNEWMSDTAENLAIPQSVKEAIGRRLDRLTPVCLEALHLAAALGKVFNFAELAAASGRSEDELLDALDEAGHAQLLRADTGDRFAFTHDKIREVLYGETNPVRRRRLHHRILEAIERVHAGRLEDHITDLAHHAVQAGEMAKGFDYSLRAVDRSERVYAHDEARRYADLARECAEALGDRPRIVQAWRARSRVEAQSGASAAAAAALIQALPWVDDDRRRNSIGIAIGLNYAAVGDRRGLDHIEAVMARIDRAAEPDQAARALSIRARYHHYDLQHRQAVALLEEARRLAAIENNPATLTNILAYLAGAYQHQAEFGPSMAIATELVELGRSRDYPLATALGHEFRGEGFCFIGQWRNAVAAADDVRRLGAEIGARDRIAWGDFIAMLARFYGGRYRRALVDGHHGLDLAVQIGELRLAALIAGYLTLLHARCGEREAWRAMAARTDALVADAGQRWMKMLAMVNLADAWLADGGAVEAAERLAHPELDDTGDNMAAYILRRTVRADAERLAGHPEMALRQAEELIAATSPRGTEYFHAIGRRQRAQLATRAGRFGEAAHDLEAALEIQARLDHRHERARTLAARADLAEARLAAGNIDPGDGGRTARSAAEDRAESERLRRLSIDGAAGDD